MKKISTVDESDPYLRAVAMLDAANAEDPNREEVDGRAWPKELLYSHRMVAMLERYRPEAEGLMKLAVRGQHVQRWKSPRDAFPMTRVGYLQWRTRLYTFHAERTAEILAEAGYDEGALQRIRQAVGKKELKQNADTQLVEDVAGLVFVEHYLDAFAEKHREYDEEKWIGILSKTWKKLSEEARAFALAGKVRVPESLQPLLKKAALLSAPG